MKKINKTAEFYTTFARKIFFLNLEEVRGCPLPSVAYTLMNLLLSVPVKNLEDRPMYLMQVCVTKTMAAYARF